MCVRELQLNVWPMREECSKLVQLSCNRFFISSNNLHFLLDCRTLRADLDWLDAVVPGVLPARPDGDLTDRIDFWQRDAVPWKGLLKRGLNRHRLQEELMTEVHAAHHSSLAILRAGGATFHPDEHQVFGGDRTEVAHLCHCGRAFTSSQGLALHRRVRHGEHAPEFQFVNGATCPACLKFL